MARCARWRSRPEARREVSDGKSSTRSTQARENDLESLFAFTDVPGFFSRLGFLEVDRGELPLKAWKDCLRCPKFQACDEIAMLKRLADHRTAVRHRVSSDLVAISLIL
jgi:hypothetical protein